MFRKSSYSTAHGACLEAAWRKSSYSHASPASDCAEAAHRDGMVLIHDTKHCKNPDTCHTVQAYTPAEWDAFIKGVKDGEFDLP